MRFKNPYATLALGLTFGAIWTGDVVFLPLLQGDAGVVFMRVVSLLVYIVFLGLAVLWLKRRHDSASARVERTKYNRAFLKATGLLGIIAYFVGVAVMFGMPGYAGLGFVLTKIIGAPLSVGVVYLFGKPGREKVSKSIALGICLAFFLFALGSYLDSLGFISDVAIAVGCGVVICIAAFVNDRGLDCVEEEIKAYDLREQESSVISRSLYKIMNGPVVTGLVLVSLMLGFVRHGLSAVNPPDAWLVVVLCGIVLVGLTLWRKPLPMGLFFQTGMLCMAIAVLLSQLFALAPVPLESLFMWASSIMLETVAISMCAWTSHNARRAFFAAILSRVIMVTGHLLGTLIVEIETSIEFSLPQGGAIAPSLLVLVFIVMMLFSYRIPTLQVLFFSLPPSDFDAEESPENKALQEASEDKPAKEEAPTIEEVMTSEESWQDVHRQTCNKIASVYSLTRREVEVLYELSMGRSVSYMADRFVLSPNTVKMHVRHVYQKLDVHSKQELIDLVNEAEAQGRRPKTAVNLDGWS